MSRGNTISSNGCLFDLHGSCDAPEPCRDLTRQEIAIVYAALKRMLGSYLFSVVEIVIRLKHDIPIVATNADNIKLRRVLDSVLREKKK